MKQNIGKFLLGLLVMGLLVGCQPNTKEAPKDEKIEEQPPQTLTIAAAASLEGVLEKELIPLFKEKNPAIVVKGVYESSGKLQKQIEEGLEADLFFSAATKQMTTLEEQNLIVPNSVVELLENKIVLIVPKASQGDILSFKDIVKAETVALGDPESVPVGQYAKEVLVAQGIWDEVSANASFGTNVTEVLSWVAEAGADTGIVYATDAQSSTQVVVVAEAPPESLTSRVLYPIGVVAASPQAELASTFIQFLESPEAKEIFETYGFTANE